MTEKPAQAQEEPVDFTPLKAKLQGSLHVDMITRTLYASSASIVEIWPRAVLVPQSIDDVRQALGFCARNRLPVTCRGAGSGVVGQSLGQGLVIDFSVHLNRILEVNNVEGWVRVEPGVVKDDLDFELGSWDYFWPPDPSSSPWCTVGAMVSNNSGGAKSVMYGTARDYLIELDLLDWQGNAFKLRPVRIDDDGALLFAEDANEIERRLANHTYQTVKNGRQVLRENRPQTTRCSSGYNLFQLLPLDEPLPGEDGFDAERFPLPATAIPERLECGSLRSGSPRLLDMPRLFCGSEGSLGVLVGAKVAVARRPKAVAGAGLSFDSDEKMALAVVELLKHTRPAKLELLERSFIDVAAKADPELAMLTPDRLKTQLIVEYFGDSEAACAKQVDQACALVAEGSDALAFDSLRAYDPRDLDKIWRIRKVASPILSRVKGDVKPTRWVEDLAVPPWKLPEFIERFKAIVDGGGFPSALFGHAGEGNLHVNPKANVKDPIQREAMRKIAKEVFAMVRGMGGVISGEHGDGTMRSPYLRSMFGDAYELMVAIKREWDPHWLLNPLTKILPPEEEAQRDIISDLRLGEGYQRHTTDTGLDDPAVLEEVEKCHGCGKCRTYCPLMEVGKDEKFSARAKANLMRAVVAGKLDADTFLLDPEMKENMDLCINCGQCLVECPTQVDIPHIAMVFREQYEQRKHRGGFVDKLLTKPDTIGRIGTSVGTFGASLLKNRFVRGVTSQLFGLDERRLLPEYRKPVGLPPLRRLKLPDDLNLPREVVLFPGCWAEYNDPDGEKSAAIEVLHALGVQVKTPAMRCCGISKVTQGRFEEARQDWLQNLDLLAPFISQGAKVLFSAPSCMLAAAHDMPRLIKTEEAKQVAEACTDIHRFLFDIFSRPDMRCQLQPLEESLTSLAYHQPCHAKVMKGGDTPMQLVKLIPDGSVTNLDAGCCGLSGTFGMKTSNFDMSMKIASKLYRRIESLNPDAVFTSCGVCQTQIMQGQPERQILHPLKLIYLAIGVAEHG